MKRNQCLCCGEMVGPEDGPLAAKHYCSRELLAATFHKSPRTMTNVTGLVEGWHNSNRCGVCGKPAVARKSVGMSDRYFCSEHVGSTRGKKTPNPFGIFVAACYRSQQ